MLYASIYVRKNIVWHWKGVVTLAELARLKTSADSVFSPEKYTGRRYILVDTAEPSASVIAQHLSMLHEKDEKTYFYDRWLYWRDSDLRRGLEATLPKGS